MANHETNSRVYNEVLRKFESTDKVHADLFNEMAKQLIDNDMYLHDNKGSVVEQSSVNGRLLVDGVNLTVYNDTTLTSEVHAASADVATAKTDITSLKTDVSTLKSDNTSTKSDVSTLKSEMATAKSDITTLKADVDAVELAAAAPRSFESLTGIDFSSKTNGNVITYENGTYKLKTPPASGSTTTKGNPGDIDLVAYNISGSGATTTGSMNAGSKVVTVASVDSFVVGQDASIPAAIKEKMLVFVRALNAPVASGTFTLTSGSNTASYIVDIKYQTYDLTFTGQAPGTTTQYGIGVDGEVKYVNLLAWESAETFATRLATDGYFTNYWPGWTLSNPSPRVLRFTSQTPGARKGATQTFANAALTDFHGAFTNVQDGSGSQSGIRSLLDSKDIPGWYRSTVGAEIIAFECNTTGPQPEIVFNAGTTGVQLEIKTMKPGKGDLNTRIASIDPTAKTLTVTTAADYTVTNVTIRHDDNRWLQKAIDDLFEAGGGQIYLPKGTYRFTRLWMKDGVYIVGSGKQSTKLVSHDLVWPSIKAVGEGSWWPNGSGDQRKEYIDTWGISNVHLTTSETGAAANMAPSKIGLEMFLANNVLIRDVNVTKHYLGVSERCSWYTHFENVMVQYCHDGWAAPYFEVSATPSNHYNVTVKDNSGLGVYLNSVDIFNFVGGAIERNAMGGVKIVGGNTRTVTFDTVNLEENGGYPVEVGEATGTAPQSISFRNCSFKNWKSTKQAVAIKLNKAVGFELNSPKFFNYTTAFDTSDAKSSFIVTNANFDGCTNRYNLNGVVDSGSYITLQGDWGGIIGQTSQGWKLIHPTSKTITVGQVADFMAAGSGGSGSGFMTYQDRGYINAALDFNATGDGSTDDTVTLQAALDKMAELRIPLYIPAGNYKISAGLVADTSKFSTSGDRNVMIFGAGGTATRIAPTSSTTFDALTIQNSSSGVVGSGVAPSGYVKDIMIEGPTSHPSGYTKGFLLKGMRQLEVRNVTVKKMPICFDMVDNCYGTVYYNCRAQLGGLGLNLRHGSISGSDMNFYNFWITGNSAGISISPDGGGWHFFGGQISGGAARSADDDDAGAVIIGKDYEAGNTGTVGNVIFDGIDFEGIRHMHLIRSFGPATVTVRNSSFLQTDTSTAGKAAATISVLKATGSAQSKFIFTNNGMKGFWKGAKAIDISGQGSLIEVYEEATSYSSGTTINNVTWTSKPLMVQSKCALGQAKWRESFLTYHLFGGTIYRETSTGKIEQSRDWGTTWTGISTSSLLADSVKIGTGSVITGVFSSLLSNYSLSTAIPELSIPANSSVDIDLVMTDAAVNDDVRVIVDNMAAGLMWTSWIAEAGKVKLRILNGTTSAVAIADTHNIRITVQKFS